MGIDRQTVVIGGGITGLACAYRLKRLGMSVTVLEASDRVGGVIAAIRQNGFLFEAGPQCPRFPRALRELVGDIGLGGAFQRANSRAKRYVLKGGRLYLAPLSPWALLGTRLVGFRDKARFLGEPFGHAKPPDSEESVADFVRRKFGDETLDFLVDPFVSAIFFGDAEEMGMESALPSVVRWEREHGSVFRGALKSRSLNGRHSSFPGSTGPPGNHSSSVRLSEALPPLGSFAAGLTALTDKLAEKLGASVRLGARVESLQLASGVVSPWLIRLHGGEEVAAESVVIAAPAYEAASLLQLARPHLSLMLAEIPYSPLVVVCSAYDRAQVRHSLEGFGFVVPRREGLHTISSTWNSSLFPDRAPMGKVVITNLARPLADEGMLELSQGAIANIVEAEVSAILGISGSPLDRAVWKYPKALPHFRIGHAQRIAEIREDLRDLSSLHLAGNYLEGRSIGDCVEFAFHVAEDVCRDLKTPATTSVTRSAELHERRNLPR
jgi:protoporphyrinogen/coproporphyrinogen III oxidase